jgi:hypothetical protein
MFKRRKMGLNGEWSLLAGNRVYELMFRRPKLTLQITTSTPYKAIRKKHLDNKSGYFKKIWSFFWQQSNAKDFLR